MVSYRIEVQGRVQGVGFRFFVLKTAEKLNIKGFVQNKKDRSVFLEASGEANEMNEFIAACRRGPTSSRVLNFKISQLPYKEYSAFKIRR